MSIVIVDGNTSRLETPRDFQTSRRNSDSSPLQKQKPPFLSNPLSSNLDPTINLLTNQFSTQECPSQLDITPHNDGNEPKTPSMPASENQKPFIRVPHKRKVRTTLKSKERYYQVEKIYNVFLAKKETPSEANENNSTKLEEKKFPKMSQKNSQNFIDKPPTSLSPTKFELNYKSRFALFSPYTKIKESEHEKVRAASQPLVSIHENASPQKSKQKELPKLLGKLPQIILYHEKEEADSLIYAHQPLENLETIQEKHTSMEPIRNKPKLKPQRGLPPIYSKKKLQDIQKQYSRSQQQDENVEDKKTAGRSSSKLKFRKFNPIENNTDQRAYTLEATMNHSFVHPQYKDQSPLKKDFKRQRSSTEHSDRISTQPSNKIQPDSLNESSLDVPDKISKTKLQIVNKKSEEKVPIKEPSGLLTPTNNFAKLNDSSNFRKHRSKSSSRYDSESAAAAEIFTPSNNNNQSMIQQPTSKKESSPEKLKIFKSESMPKNSQAHIQEKEKEKSLPPVEKFRKKEVISAGVGIQDIWKPKKEEKLTDDQRYQKLINNKIEDQFSHLFKHFRTKKSKNKKVQFITES